MIDQKRPGDTTPGAWASSLGDQRVSRRQVGDYCLFSQETGEGGEMSGMVSDKAEYGGR